MRTKARGIEKALGAGTIPVLLASLLVVAGCTKERSATAKEDVPASAAAQPASGGERDPDRLYCQEHQCYEDVCILCHEELREEGRLWCTEHSRYEDRCFLCHPELKEAQRPYCQTHFLYEDECFMCRPELKDQTQGSLHKGPSSELMCQEHGVPENECGICHPDLAALLAPGQGLKVRFGSKEAAAKAGIETGYPSVSPMASGVECYGEIVFNQNRMTAIVAPVSGVVHNVAADLGSRVSRGEIVATLWSTTIAEAVSRATLAQQTLAREAKLHAEGISSEKELQQAQAANHIAQQNLRTLGSEDSELQALSEDPGAGARLAVRSPFSGEIVERRAVSGTLVEAGSPLFTLADRAVMWAMLNIPEPSLARVQVGQRVQFTVDAFPGQPFEGTLTWISAEIDDRTRMAQARAEIANPNGALRAHMFANARILTSANARAVIVPTSAIQSINNRDFVFVRVEDDLYDARSVQIGSRFGGRAEVIEGLSPTDAVVVAGGFAAKSQLLISRLGAGCVDD